MVGSRPLPSGDFLTDLNTFVEETTVKIITGVEPLSSYDEAVQTYMEIGGEELIAERTRQFKESVQ
jgi:hypothetical protein